MPPPVRPFVILVHGGKGGISKTTIAEHLAWLFAEVGKVLLLDADNGQQSAKWLYDRYVCSKPFDVTVGSDPDLIRSVHRVPYDFVIIDGPPSRHEVKAAVEVADLVLVPLIPRIIDTGAVMRTIKTQLGGKRFHVVITRVTNTMGRTRLDSIRAALMGQEVPFLGTVIREYLGPHEVARMRGLPVTHEELAKPIEKPGDGTPADRAAYDLKHVFAEVRSLVGAS